MDTSSTTGSRHEIFSGAARYIVKFHSKTMGMISYEGAPPYLAGIESFVIALSCQAFLALMTTLVSKPLYPRSYEKEKKANKKLWATTAASLIPAIFAPSFALPGLIQLFREGRDNDFYDTFLLRPSNAIIYRGLGISTAHFWFDFIVMAIYADDYILAMKRPLYKQMMFHHLAAGLVWPYAVASEKCVAFVAYFMCTEASNIFLNLRWFLAEHQIQSTLRTAMDLAFFISFTLLRVMPVFPVLYLIAMTNWLLYFQSCSLLQAILTFLCIVPFGLNLFWYSIIINMVRKSLSASSSVNKDARRNQKSKKIKDPQHASLLESQNSSNGHQKYRD